MKTIIIAVALTLLMSMQLEAENSIEYEKKEKNEVGVVIDNELILIYEKLEKLHGENRLEILQYMLKNKICTDKELRSVIVEDHMNLKFIYLGEDEVIIAKIDSCDGVDMKSEVVF